MTELMTKVPKYGSDAWFIYIAQERLDLENRVGQVWSTTELQEDFIVHSFMAPFCSVEKKDTGVKGLLAFQTDPRFYYDFTPNAGEARTGIFVKKPNRD